MPSVLGAQGGSDHHPQEASGDSETPSNPPISSSDQLDALLRTTPDHAIFMIDLGGVVQSWNFGAERLHGCSAGDAIGCHYSAFFSPQDRDRGRPLQVLEATLRNGRYQAEEERTRKDGSIFLADVVLSVLFSAVGKPSGYVCVTRNLSAAEQARSELRAREASLAASLRERDALLQEVHHRVTNNLQVITSLLSLQMRQTQNPEALEALEAWQSRIMTIATVHEQLYQSTDYSQIPSHNYVARLAENVFQSREALRLGVELQLDVDRFALPVEHAIPCGLILNELMTNAVQHAFPGGRSGTVHVKLKKKSPGMVELSVSDDGVGLPEGFSISRAETMGMQLIATLLEQLRGKVEQCEGTGANLCITFPVNEGSEI